MHHRPKNVEKQEERESDSVKIKLKCHLVIEFSLIKSIGDNFRVIAIVVQPCKQIQKLSYRALSEESTIIMAGGIRSHCERMLY